MKRIAYTITPDTSVIRLFGVARNPANGFPARPLELNHNRVEGLALEQGIIARIFNAGTITVNGTGGTEQEIPFIIRPMEFRRNALEVIDANP